MLLFKKILRTISKYKAQFISMIIMTFIGCGVFLGFNCEWKSLQEDGNRFFKETNYLDYYLQATSVAFKEEECEKLLTIDEIENAALKAEINTSTIINNKTKTITLNILSDYVISTNYIVEGKEYDESIKGIYLNDKFAKENNLKLNDEINLTYGRISLNLPIVSLIKNPDYLYAVEDEKQVMPDFASYGYVYISPTYFNELVKDYHLSASLLYSKILIKSNSSKNVLEEKINQVMTSPYILLEKEKSKSYAMLVSEVEEGQTMGSIIPVVFLLISILTMSTTMQRIASNEQMQIGILKALGFKNKKILMHYSYLGLFVAIISCGLSLPVGFGIGKFIVNPNAMEGTAFDMPYWNLYMPWWSYLALMGVFLLISLYPLLAIRKILKGSAASTLRPVTVKKVKQLLIEKTALWKKMSFSTKWNLRDMFRHKARTIMALIGVFGCTVLTSGCLGMNDTMKSMITLLDDTVYNFNYKINITDSAKNEDVLKLIEDKNCDYVKTASIKLNEEAYEIDIYNISHNYIKVLDSKYNNVTLEDNGVYVCNRIAKENNIKVGDTLSFNLYGINYTYTVKVSKIVNSFLSKNIILTENYAKTLINDQNKSLNEIIPTSYVLTNEVVNKTDYSIISSLQNKKDIISSYDQFMNILYMMIAILIIFAMLLCFIVLYNLGAMSYIERYRELSTLKVVGFKDKQVGKLLVKQNTWISLFGTLLGLLGGYLLLTILMKALASEYEVKCFVSALSLLISFMITMITSYLVSKLVSLKNKKINMVEALKINE